MGRFVEGEQRSQLNFLPASLDEYVDAENPVRVVDVFIEELDLTTLDFWGPAATGRPGYHPATLLKIYLNGYLNRIQSSRAWKLPDRGGWWGPTLEEAIRVDYRRKPQWPARA